MKRLVYWNRSLVHHLLMVFSMLMAYVVIFISVNGFGFALIETFDTVILKEYQYLILHFFEMFCVMTLVIVFMFYVDKKPFYILGFYKKKWLTKICLGLIVGGALIAMGFVTLLLMKEIAIDYIYVNFKYLSISFLIMTIVAFEEEIILRGYILRNLMLSMNKYMALLLSSILFSLLHVFNDGFNSFVFLQITLAGILLGVSYIYTNSLWFPIALHFSWNFFQGTVFGFNVSGVEEYSFIVQKPVTDNLLNGGSFGFEGSIICTGIMMMAIICQFVYFKSKIGKISIYR